MFNLLRNREREGLAGRRLNSAATDGLYFLQRLKLDKKLCVHDGCVNTISWNESGTLILSGSDDQHLAITNPFSGKNIVKFRSGHRSNIFSAKFLPGSLDKEVVSCSGSGEIFYTDVDREDTYGANRFDCHFGTTYKLLVVPNEAATFLSCGDDGTVRFFDLRTKTSCSKFNCEEDVVIHLRNAVTAMAVDPIIPFQLAVASSDGMVRLYDRRMLKARETGGNNASLICKFPPPIAGGEKRPYRITSLNYRQGSHDVLVNYSSENIYLFNTYETTKQQCYSARSDGTTSKPVAMTSQSANSEGCAGPNDGAVGGVSAPADNGSDSESAFKPIKRLRLRGDWSDTGPDARPESEEPALTNTIMQRMSDLLTRMLNSRSDRSEGQEGAEGEEEEEAASRRDELDLPEGDVRAETATSTAADAATVLRSVMFRSASAAAVRAGGTEDNPARYSISSEGLVSPELSSVEMDSGIQGEAPFTENETQITQNEVVNDSNKINSNVFEKKIPSDSGHTMSNLSATGQNHITEQGANVRPSEGAPGDAILSRQADLVACANDSSLQNRAETSGFQELKSVIGSKEEKSHFSTSFYEFDINTVIETKNSVESSASDNANKSDVSDGEGDQICNKMNMEDNDVQHSEGNVNKVNTFSLHGEGKADSSKVLLQASDNVLSTKGETPNQGMEVVQESSRSPILESVRRKPHVARVDSTKPSFTNEKREYLKSLSSMESSSESNDSISEQMSANLHIKSTMPGMLNDAGKQSQGNKEAKQFPNQNTTSESEQLPTKSDFTQLHDLQGTKAGQSFISTSHFTAETSNNVVINDQPQVLTSAFSAENSSSTPSKLNSLFTCSPSWSESTVAIADGALSSCEGSNSQRTLNDITGFTGVSSLSSAVPSITEVTPTAIYTRDCVKNPSINPGPGTCEQSTISGFDHGLTIERESTFPAQTFYDRDIESTDNQKDSCDGNILQPDYKSSVPPSQQCSDLTLSHTSQPKVDDERAVEQNFSEVQKYPSKPILGVFTSESSNIVETAMVIPHACKSCGDEFAVRVEDMDCGQVQERMKTGLCPQCFRKLPDKYLSVMETRQAAAINLDKKNKDEEAIMAEELLDDEDESFMLGKENNSRNVYCDKLQGQAIVGKGKGVGKSSARAKKLVEERESSFAPYNSGKMRISSGNESPSDLFKSCGMSSSTVSPAMDMDIKAETSKDIFDGPSCSTGAESSSFTQSQTSTSYKSELPALKEKSTRAATYHLPGFRSCSQGSERQRRAGYSLPPTGNFQLHGDDDDDEDDENANIKRKINLDRERMSRAAQKIQEVYRKKREAKEMAKMMEVPEPRVLMKYSGHRNCRTMIKEANFFGDHYVISGSDCGRILAWERETGHMVMYMDADKHVVNCVQPNLYLPILASSGIDYDIKIWSPLEEEPQFDEEKAEMIIRRNELMLEETRDTVTVPAAFMLRILASLSQIRTGRNNDRGQGAQVSSGQE